MSRRRTIKLKRGTPAFDAWLRHWRRTDPRLAQAAEGALFAVVPRRWPPNFVPPRRTTAPETLHRTRQAAGERQLEETTNER